MLTDNTSPGVSAALSALSGYDGDASDPAVTTQEPGGQIDSELSTNDSSGNAATTAHASSADASSSSHAAQGRNDAAGAPPAYAADIHAAAPVSVNQIFAAPTLNDSFPGNMVLQQAARVAYTSWFRKVLPKANPQALPELWKADADGKLRRLNESEFDAWQKRVGDWLQGYNLPNLLEFFSEIIVIGPDGKPRFTFPVISMDVQAIRNDIAFQPTILVFLTKHIWTADLLTHHEILRSDDGEIHYQFWCLVEKLQLFMLELIKAATPPNCLNTMYSDVMDNSFWKNQPMHPAAAYVGLKDKMAQDLTCSAIELLQDLLALIENMAAKPAISINQAGEFLDHVKNKYDIIIQKNQQIEWSANNQIQSKLYALFPVLCRLAARDATDYHLANGASKLEEFFLFEDGVDLSNCRSFEDFHHRTMGALQKHLPTAPSQK
jgi:hypothetical protein